jgi:ankyrin repeat protein
MLNYKLLLIFLCVSTACLGMNKPLILSKSERAYKKKSKLTVQYGELFLKSVVNDIEKSLSNNVGRGEFASLEEELRDKGELASHALCYAVKNKKYNCIEFLLDRDANPNMLLDKGNSFLHLVRDGECTQLLINRRANVNHKNDEGRTPFFSAIVESHCDIGSILLKAGACIDEVDLNNDTPLHYAVVNLSPQVIKFLLYSEADPNKPNKHGVTSYQMALACGGVALSAFEQCRKVFTAINTPVGNFTVMKLLAQDGCLLKKILKINPFNNRCLRDLVIAEQLLQQCDDEVFSELGSDNSSCDADLVKLAQLIKQREQNQKDFLEALRNNEFKKAKDYVQANPYILYVHEGQTDEMSILFAKKFLAIASYDPDYCHIKELLKENFDFNIRDNNGTLLLSELTIVDNIKYEDFVKWSRNARVV